MAVADVVHTTEADHCNKPFSEDHYLHVEVASYQGANAQHQGRDEECLLPGQHLEVCKQPFVQDLIEGGLDLFQGGLDFQEAAKLR